MQYPIKMQLEENLLIYCSSIDETRSSSNWGLIPPAKKESLKVYKHYVGNSRPDYLAHDRYMTYFQIIMENRIDYSSICFLMIRIGHNLS